MLQRLLRARSSKAAAVYALALLAFAAAYADREPYDDGHFFKRVALNALDHGELAWNLDEGPVYGSTSQVFQLLSVLVAALSRDHFMLLTRALAGLTLWLAFVRMQRLTAEHDRGSAVAYAFCMPVLLFPLLSGMETALAVLLLCIGLSFTYASASGPRSSLFAAFVVLVYLTRPDAALLALLPWLVERRSSTKRWPVWDVALVAGLMAVTLLALRAYYGTALPLPFYAKHAAFSPYDSHFIAAGRPIGLQRFGLFALCAAPLLLAGLLRRDRINVTLLGSAMLFIGYHLVATIDVMGMHGRFFAPALPCLMLAAARGLGAAQTPEAARRNTRLTCAVLATFALLLATLGGLPPNKGFGLDRTPVALYVVLAVSALALLASPVNARVRSLAWWGIPIAAALGSLLLVRPEKVRAYSDEDFLALHTSRYTVYRGLDVLRACFGDALHVYHSEVGVPGLRFQPGKVTDLAGLLSPAWLFRETSFDQACSAQQPEAIFLPHKNYVGLNREIRSSQCIAGYTRVVKKSSSPLFVRNDLVPRFAQCSARAKDKWIAIRRR